MKGYRLATKEVKKILIKALEKVIMFRKRIFLPNINYLVSQIKDFY
jgi:hypothetical protein